MGNNTKDNYEERLGSPSKLKMLDKRAAFKNYVKKVVFFGSDPFKERIAEFAAQQYEKRSGSMKTLAELVKEAEEAEKAEKEAEAKVKAEVEVKKAASASDKIQALRLLPAERKWLKQNRGNLSVLIEQFQKPGAPDFEEGIILSIEEYERQCLGGLGQNEAAPELGSETSDRSDRYNDKFYYGFNIKDDGGYEHIIISGIEDLTWLNQNRNSLVALVQKSKGYEISFSTKLAIDVLIKHLSEEYSEIYAQKVAAAEISNEIVAAELSSEKDDSEIVAVEPSSEKVASEHGDFVETKPCEKDILNINLDQKIVGVGILEQTTPIKNIEQAADTALEENAEPEAEKGFKIGGKTNGKWLKAKLDNYKGRRGSSAKLKTLNGKNVFNMQTLVEQVRKEKHHHGPESDAKLGDKISKVYRAWIKRKDELLHLPLGSPSEYQMFDERTLFKHRVQKVLVDVSIVLGACAVGVIGYEFMPVKMEHDEFVGATFGVLAGAGVSAILVGVDKIMADDFGKDGVLERIAEAITELYEKYSPSMRALARRAAKEREEVGIVDKQDSEKLLSAMDRIKELKLSPNENAWLIQNRDEITVLLKALKSSSSKTKFHFAVDYLIKEHFIRELAREQNAPIVEAVMKWCEHKRNVVLNSAKHIKKGDVDKSKKEIQDESEAEEVYAKEVDVADTNKMYDIWVHQK
ncbi:MAG: hypothetical protein LBM01_03190 [Christensenellaceae bacterium]|jgi:hypothetical protein|nr:hypothetical protein [Christensenellaceae bacterium]